MANDKKKKLTLADLAFKQQEDLKTKEIIAAEESDEKVQEKKPVVQPKQIEKKEQKIEQILEPKIDTADTRELADFFNANTREAKTSFSIYVTTSLHNELKAVAKKAGTTVNTVIVKFLEVGLKNLKK
ncbi:hypothetical protein [[Mycoplasma] testudinis]|uniref:hypothetical protein n=1 Tax=[Mycoplasma] testudinis TaxID=33924 RepID=UPI00048424A0|nr:hypothetical protein [[Mycoplasma] testudinis]